VNGAIARGMGIRSRPGLQTPSRRKYDVVSDELMTRLVRGRSEQAAWLRDLGGSFGEDGGLLCCVASKAFRYWLRRSCIVPLIQQLNTQADKWCAAEMARARRLLTKGESVDAVLEVMSRGLTQKMMHGAMAELHAGDAASREQTIQTISRMFLCKER
jgi:hypothetical protein